MALSRLHRVSSRRLIDPDAEQVRRDQNRAIEQLQDEFISLSGEARQGRWKYVDRQDARAPTNELAFGGLDGEVDGEYLIRGQLISEASAASYDLRINGNDGSRSLRIQATSALVLTTAFASTTLTIAASISNGVSSFEGQFSARARTTRRYQGTSQHYASGSLSMWQVMGAWDDLSDRVISLSVRRQSSANMGAGSWVELYRRAV